MVSYIFATRLIGILDLHDLLIANLASFEITNEYYLAVKLK